MNRRLKKLYLYAKIVTMDTAFNITRTSRQIYNSYFDQYTLEQLNKVPEGFNNNLIWNIGHIIVVQQMLVYKGSGQEALISGDLIMRYMPGTKPEREIMQEEADELKALLFTTIDKTEEDYHDGSLFTAYTERKTKLGFSISTVEDAIAFNNYHEGTHLGIMMGLKKFI
jgi:hypothetical protein